MHYGLIHRVGIEAYQINTEPDQELGHILKGRIRFQCLFDEVYANFVGRAKW